jgi:hypothetical protein
MGSDPHSYHVGHTYRTPVRPQEKEDFEMHEEQKTQSPKSKPDAIP